MSNYFFAFWYLCMSTQNHHSHFIFPWFYIVSLSLLIFSLICKIMFLNHFPKFKLAISSINLFCLMWYMSVSSHRSHNLWTNICVINFASFLLFLSYHCPYLQDELWHSCLWLFLTHFFKFKMKFYLLNKTNQWLFAKHKISTLQCCHAYDQSLLSNTLGQAAIHDVLDAGKLRHGRQLSGVSRGGLYPLSCCSQPP